MMGLVYGLCDSLDDSGRTLLLQLVSDTSISLRIHSVCPGVSLNRLYCLVQFVNNNQVLATLPGEAHK